MIRDILTNKWIIGAAFLLLIFAGACYLYYQYTTAHYKAATTQDEKLLEQWKADKAKPPTLAKTESTQAPAESITPTAEKPTQQTGNIKEVKVSPYGLGSFPKIPKHSPIPQDWFDYPRSSKRQEIMARVIVKLWQDGKPNYGGTMSSSTGLVYPTFPNRIIVEWASKDTPFGTIRYATRISWCPEAEGFQQQMKGKTIYEDDFPSHFKIVEPKDAGIDPYEYLDLPR